MARKRKPAVAGIFYPDDPEALRRYVDDALRAAARRAPHKGRVRAIIAPHAAYHHSGDIAATAYAALRHAGAVRRIALLGPAHTVPVRGLVAPLRTLFGTPLGDVPVDVAGRDALIEADLIHATDVPHQREHSLEVHLPFIRRLYPGTPVLPLVVGEASPREVARVLAELLDEETLIIVSSDLSHHGPREAARAHDLATARRIEALDDTPLTPQDACGAHAINGLLRLARERGWRPLRLDLRNSGDTAGDKSHVVGYGAWAFAEPVAADVA